MIKKNSTFAFFVGFLLFAAPAWAQVSITSPAANATVSGTVSITCADSAPNSKTGLYIDQVYVSGSPYSWNTTTAANGSHYLLCNGYVNGSANGTAAENVTVNNSGHTPVPTATPTGSPTSAPTPGACASTVDVFCTGSADSHALQAAMNCPGSVVRPHGTCDVNQGLVGTNIGYEGADATLNIEPSVATGVTLVTGASAYNSKPWRHLRLTGTGATGLLLEGNFTHIDQPSINGFTNNIMIGPNAFLDTIIAPTIWSGGTGLNCPTANNAGEGIVVVGGEIFNLVNGTYNAGCSLTLFGTHFDAITGTPLALNEGLNGAETDCTNCYVELMVQPSSGVVLSVTGFDAGGSMEWIGGHIQQDNSNASTLLASLTNTGSAGTSPYVRVSNTRLRDIAVTGLSTNPNVALCADISVPLSGGGLIGNIPNSGICP